MVNSYHQQALKGSKEFRKENEQLVIVKHIKEVVQAFFSIDLDLTVCKTLEMLKAQFCTLYKLAFANGGKQNINSIPEVPICHALGIKLLDEMGEKIQFGSWLLSK